MKILGLLLLLVSQSDTLGKSDAQILAMGRSGWYRFYSGKTDESPAAFRSSQELYARALGHRNDRLLRARSATDRGRILALRQEVGAFARAMTTVDGEGGTLDDLTASDRAIDVQELIERLARRHWTGIPSRKISDVAGPLSGRRAVPGSDASEALARARSGFARIAKLLKGSPRRESDAVLHYLRTLVVVADQR